MINEAHAELLGRLCIRIPVEDIEPEKIVEKPPHGCDAPTIETYEGYTVCEGCGLVLKTDQIEKDPPQYRNRRAYRHEGSQWLGGDEDSYMPRKRFYKSLTQFRQYLRAYLFARSVDLPEDMMIHLRINVSIDSRDAYTQVKRELKKLKRQKFYKDAFTIIYALGGIKPQVSPETVDAMCNYFKRWFFHFNSIGRYGRHNTPSILMMVDIILREFDHEPYYYIPTLKSQKLRERVLQIYDEVKLLCHV